MTGDRLERELPDLLLDLYLQPEPAYRDDILGRVARTRQRPSWTFPGRWLPVADITTERVAAPRLPWRAIAVALLLIALAAGALLVIGSQQTKLPAPFGLARTGLVAYSEGGDIYTADPVSRVVNAVVTGPENDLDPRWSLDGTRLAFVRKVTGGSVHLYGVRSDGSDLTLLTPDPFLTIDTVTFSPDGHEVLIGGSARVTAEGVSTTDPGIFIVEVDGSGTRGIDVGMVATSPAYRPPRGEEITFLGAPTIGGHEGIYAVNADGTGLRTIVAPTTLDYLGGALWSPDGTRLAYHKWHDDPDLTARVHVVLADGTGDTVLEPDSLWNAAFAWSNDGTRLAIIRGYNGGYQGARFAAIPADGSGPGVEMQFAGDPQPECCSTWAWAPDDSAILGTPTDTSGNPLAQVLWDPSTGTSRPAPWAATSVPTWQRLAE